MMRKLNVIILTVLFNVSILSSIFAQNLIVRKFEENSRDLSARVKERTDLNGISCALVKIDLPLKNVVVADYQSVGSVDYVVNTYWVYLPAGAKKLTIQHPNFHTLTVNFPDFGIPYVNSKTTYDMIVDLPNATTDISDVIVRESFPDNANITDLIDTKIITVKGVSFTMVYVKGGAFMMGASDIQGEFAGKNEGPLHKVTLSDYYIGKFEVTQKLWKVVMGNNPSKYPGDDRPVDSVSWDDCNLFISRLNSLSGLIFSLPTEAQWEYAAKGGVFAEDFLFSGSNKIGSVAWFGKNTKATKNVGIKQPNALGIFDMSGNVGEWCLDYYDFYTASTLNNPSGPEGGSNRVTRGGDWYSEDIKCRTTYRIGAPPYSKYDDMGFRIVLNQ